MEITNLCCIIPTFLFVCLFNVDTPEKSVTPWHSMVCEGEMFTIVFIIKDNAIQGSFTYGMVYTRCLFLQSCMHLVQDRVPLEQLPR